ncbi:MAG: TldD/PmbA family protein [Candidatus Parvarchaeota archaeon]|nr:TldD/PmbA family protein [Candidatus Jingweiarchaeum tengchongense]MCW1297867.1 TldD/PmbA family protein [Candidatus Jingweiarchaeum tengchongense]MCW1299878.1 TldD/PmbA family protein [Candidatus Jingweiarchaeum tengchongense]MCW1304152.1 TldD/PmbA family protein [Candidatus Jingweiarchaeum tengchongense]MCW1305180.1 TldD/PmbA family protein [Candidatus Jingweiarchaeum tengchongense]
MDFEDLIKKRTGIAKYVDLRIEDVENETIIMKNNEISSISSIFSAGFSFRVFLENGIGFACSSDFSKKEDVLKRALKLARAQSNYKQEKIEISRFESNRDKYRTIYKRDPFEISLKTKIAFLKEINKRLEDKRIKSTILKLSFSKLHKKFMNDKGADISADFLYSMLKINVAGREMNKSSECFFSVGKIGGYEIIENLDIENVAKELKEKNLRLLHARYAKKGRYNVICDPILSGVFFHEAVGHACEADQIIRKESILMDKMNKKIGSEKITLYDDPLIEFEPGFYRYDDEGTKARKTTLIDRGTLISFLNSMVTSNKLNLNLTSNGRAQSPFELPIPRMSNTSLKPGECKADEMIKELKSGIYAKGSRGGVVEPTLGNFIFNAEEAFLIKNGEIVENLRDFSLSGNILETLLNVVEVADDAHPQYLGAMCGKLGQVVPVGSATPHILVKGVIVGGR